MLNYTHAGAPRQYNAKARIVDSQRSAEGQALSGHLRGELGSSKYIGHHQEELGHWSNFGGQNKDLSGPMLSDNEKTLAAVGVIAVVGWLFLGPKIKKAFKR